MTTFQDLPKALVWLRLHSRRRQNEVAHAAGLTQAMLCAYERGTREPSLRSLGRLLAALGTSVEDLGRLLAKLEAP